MTLTWLNEGTYKFDVLYADAEDGVWKELAAGLQAAGKDADDGGTVSVKAPDAVEASALKIIVTGVTDGCDVALGSIEVAGSWNMEGVKVACESDDSNNNEDQEDQKENTMIISQKRSKKHQVSELSCMFIKKVNLQKKIRRKFTQSGQLLQEACLSHLFF